MKIINIEIPDIDDCGQLYSLASRSGCSSVYLACHEYGGAWWCQLSYDSNAPEGPNDCANMGAATGPYDSPEAALLANVGTAREWFSGGGLQYVYCDASRRVIARRK